MASGAVNAARQLGSVMGTSLLGTLLVGDLTSHLPGELQTHQVPAAYWPAVEHAVAAGTTHGPTPPAVTAAVGDAFTSGVHAGLLVTAVVFLCAAVPAAALVRNRPHHS